MQDDTADGRKLSAKQKVFVSEYLKDFNATRSAIAAGYSEKSAASIGHENLIKPEIKDYIQSKLAMLTDGLMLSRETVLLELSRYAFRDRFTAHRDVSHRESLAALTTIGKHIGLFEEGADKGKKEYEIAFEEAIKAMKKRS